MFINAQNPLDSVIKNLGLNAADSGSNTQVMPQFGNSLIGQSNDLIRPLPLPLPYPGTQQSQFNQMFQNVVQLFKTFVGAMRDLGLVKQPETDATQGTEGTQGSSGTGTTGTTTGTTETPQADGQDPLGAILDKFLSPLKEIFGSLGDKLTGFIGKVIAKPSSLLNPIKNIFKKAKKLFTGKGSILTTAFGLIKSFL